MTYFKKKLQRDVGPSIPDVDFAKKENMILYVIDYMGKTKFNSTYIKNGDNKNNPMLLYKISSKGKVTKYTKQKY